MIYDAERVPELLGPDGPLRGHVSSFEDRPDQRAMVLEVARTLEVGGRLAVEAPTGIGKSLAYGLPAALWARAGNGPVVVATYTRALQDQLLDTEAPRLRAVVDGDLRVEVLKGRQNYVCLRRLDQAAREHPGAGTQALLGRVRAWAETSDTGDLALSGERDGHDLRFLRLYAVSDPAYCAHRECTPATCFFKKARGRAAEADLLVVNHALLAIHLFEGGGILPGYDALVVDEAHAFLQVCLDHLAVTIGPASLHRIAERVPPHRPDWLRTGEGDTWMRALDASLEHATTVFRGVFGKGNGARPDGDERQRYRSAEDLLRICPLPLAPAEEALGRLEADAASIESFLDRSVDTEDPERPGVEAALARFREEVGGARRALDDLLHPDPSDEGRVHWKEWSGDGFQLSASPLEVGPRLAPALEKGPTRVVFTSATLAAGEDFGYFSRETGLGERLHALALQSPFDYARQTAVFAVGEGPDPRSPLWPVRVAETLHALLTDPRRNTLALFTSYRDVAMVEEALSRLGGGQAYSVTAQRPGTSPADLVDRFRASGPGVLLGTASFWQGIDLPGDALEVLVVTRLPFGVPTDPRLQARSERLEAAGGNPFMDLYVPEAVLRFKQGFGRLIRRASDRGIVAVLDPRLRTKGYGKRFARALPVDVTAVRDGAELAARAAAWWHAGPNQEGDGTP